MTTTASVSNGTSTTSTLTSPPSTTTTTTSPATTRVITTPPSSTTSTISTSLSPTDNDQFDNLEIILPCVIIGGVILIVIAIFIFYKIRQRKKQKREPSPPTLPSFTIPKLNDIPIESSIDLPQKEAIKPVLPRDKDSLETRESVASVASIYSDGYVVPCIPPIKEIQDDSEYIDMTQQEYLPKCCGVVNNGYVNDPRNLRTNIFTTNEITSHYQNTGNCVSEMKPIETVNEYANIKNKLSECTKRPISDIYENTKTTVEDNQLLDYENAPAKVSIKNVKGNENFNTNIPKIQIKPKKLLPSPCPQSSRESRRSKSSPRGSPRSKSSPRGSPWSESSPRGSPRSKSSPRESPRSENSPGGSPRTESSPRGSPRSKSSPRESPRSENSPGGSPRPESSPRGSPRYYPAKCKGVKVM